MLAGLVTPFELHLTSCCVLELPPKAVKYMFKLVSRLMKTSRVQQQGQIERLQRADLD